MRTTSPAAGRSPRPAKQTGFAVAVYLNLGCGIVVNRCATLASSPLGNPATVYDKSSYPAADLSGSVEPIMVCAIDFRLPCSPYWPRLRDKDFIRRNYDLPAHNGESARNRQR